jgi:hypothetical protein
LDKVDMTATLWLSYNPVITLERAVVAATISIRLPYVSAKLRLSYNPAITLEGTDVAATLWLLS